MGTHRIWIVATLLSFTISISPAQQDIRRIPSFFSGSGSAALFEGRNSLFIVAAAETSGYVPVPEVWYTRGFTYLVQMDSARNFTRPFIIDTLSSSSFGLGGRIDDCIFDATESITGALAIAATHRSTEWTDVPPYYILRGTRLECKAIIRSVATNLFSDSSANNARIASDAFGTIHIAYESLKSLEPSVYQSFTRARSTILHRVFPVLRKSGTAPPSPDSVGVGFRPQLALDDRGTAYVAWIACDSTFSLSGTITLAKIAADSITRIPLRTFKIMDPTPYSTYWRLPEIHLAVDDNRTAWISWTERYPDNLLFVARVTSDNQITIDSLLFRSEQLYDHALGVGKNGTGYLVWSATANGLTNLFVSSGDAGRRMFESVRTVAPCVSGSYAHLVRNNRGEVSCVYNSGGGISYVRNLAETHNPLTLVSGTSLATVDFGFWYGYWNILRKSAIQDQYNKLYVAFNKPFSGDSSDVGLRLLAADEPVLDVGNDRSALPTDVSLSQNYPNPFNPTTVIKFSIAKLAIAKLQIFDMLGREVATLVNERKPAGTYRVTFHAAHLSSGVYFCRLEVVAIDDPGKRYAETRKLILAK